MASLLTKIAPGLLDYSDPTSFVSRIRKKRFEGLKKLLVEYQQKLDRKIYILDVGGSYIFWKQCGLLDPKKFHIILLNLKKPRLPDRASGFSARTGNACCIKPQLAGVDVLFSNSVIEHVGGYKKQKEMSDEFRGSGLPYAVQTPNFWFPLEPHAHVPGFQFIPHSIRAGLIRMHGFNYFPKKGTYKECLEVSLSTQMLTLQRIKHLFPEASIHKERFLGMPKSFTAISPHF